MLGWLVSDFGLYPPVSLYLYIVYINIDDPVGYRGTQRDTGGVKQQFFFVRLYFLTDMLRVKS